MLDLNANPSPRASNDATPLHFAARTGQGYLASNLIKHGAEVDAKDSHGRTPLILAIDKADVPMAKLLIKNGCNVNIVDRSHRSPLSIATTKGLYELEELLRSHGASQLSHTIRKPSSKVAEHTKNQGRSY